MIEMMKVPSSRTHLRWSPVLFLLLALGHPIFAKPGGELCFDRVDFRYQDKEKKNCDWVAEQKKKRCKIELGNGTRIRDLCCETCGKHGVYDFIIGGMGPSGIGAVFTLETIGQLRNYLVLEAKEDMGGKVWSTEFGGYTVETAAGYISGGVDNPLFCEMENFVNEGNSFRGYDVQYKLRVNDDDGNKVVGDWYDGWDYQWGSDTDYYGGMPQTVAERFVRAFYEAEWYGYKCLNQDRYDRLVPWQRRQCNNICKINTTEIPSDHVGPEGILDLRLTQNNPCFNTGKWDPSYLTSSDISLTDLMRVDPGPPEEYLDGAEFQPYFAQDDPDGVCVARVIEYIFADKEVGISPWRTSAADWFGSRAVFGEGSDFGEERDFIVADERSYIYLYKRKLARVLATSVNTSEKIVIDEPDRLSFNSKITNVKWDPTGEKDVIITYCKTEKEGQQSYPCVDSQRYIRRAKNFISTFTIGVLKRSVQCERENDSNCPVPRFDPPLSGHDEVLTKTLDNLDMATLTKVYLQFKKKFWGNKETYFTPSNSSGYDCDAAPLIYSLDGKDALDGSKIIAIALTGERGKEAANIETSGADTRDWVCEEFLPVLNNHFEAGIDKKFGRELKCRDIVDIFIPTWINDPLSLGCWVVSPLGSAGKIEFDYQVMGNLILSGEATCERHTGWVPGGYYSGEQSVLYMLRERIEGFEDLNTKTICNYKASKHFDFNDVTCHFDQKQE